MEFKSIMIPLDGTPSNEEMVEFFCSLQKALNSELFLVRVVEVPRNLPLDAELPELAAAAKSSIQNAVRISEKYGVPLNTSIIYARSSEDAIISTASDLKVDVIAIAQDNHKLGIFANAAANIYQRAKCSVWLFNNRQ